MSVIMNTVSKTWAECGDNFEIKFHYNPEYLTIIAAPFFEIDSVSPREYGDYDKNELSFFPASLTITLVSYLTPLHRNFKAVLDLYKETFPFNFKQRFYTEYFKNGTLLHQGVLANVDGDIEAEKVELLISSGTKYFENVSIASANYLDALAAAGLPRHAVDYGTGYSYGLDNLALVPASEFGRYNVQPGLATDTPFNLASFVHLLLRAVNPENNFAIDNDLLFGDAENNCVKTISDLWIFAVYSNYLGRYLVLDKTNPLYSFIDVFDEEWETADETSTHKVYLYKEDQAVGDKNLIPVIDNICYNFFSRMAWKSFDSAVMQKKFSCNPDSAILIEARDVKENTHKKQTYIPAVKWVKVNDLFSGFNAERGSYEDTLTDEQKLEYSINFSAYDNGSSSGYSLFYYDGTTPKAALYMKDPVSGYVNRVPETLAELEWRHRKEWRDKIPLTLTGADRDYSAIYKMRDETDTIKILRPMKMSADDDADETEVEFIDITPA